MQNIHSGLQSPRPTDARRFWRFIVPALSCALLSTVAHAAWDFSPTATEWQAWPMYCRVQYSWVNQGFDFEYGGKFPNDIVDDWRRTVGPETFIHLHHYCASIHFLNRSRTETDPQQHRFILERAWTDALYTLTRADPLSVVYPLIAVTAAQIRIEMGKPDEAEEILRKSMQAQPKRAEPYVMFAILARKQHKLADARDMLRQADEATGGASAEIQYNLGLINLELGDVAAAAGNARKAYSAGYPLPGLKNKLRKIGKWSDADEAAIAQTDAPASAPAASAAGTAAPSR